MQYDDLPASVLADRMQKIAHSYPNMAVHKALEWAMSQKPLSPMMSKGMEPLPALNDKAALGTWLYKNSPETVEQIVGGKLIYAIKEARTLTNCGLKEAKEAVEYIKYTIMGKKPKWPGLVNTADPVTFADWLWANAPDVAVGVKYGLALLPLVKGAQNAAIAANKHYCPLSDAKAAVIEMTNNPKKGK